MDQRFDTFLGLEPEHCAYGPSRVVLLPVPYDGTASFAPGARFGPRAIVEASAQVELYDVELQQEPWTVGVSLLPALSPSAAGPEAVVEQVAQACGQVLADGKRPFVLGGEHTVTVGAARAARAGRPAGQLSFLLVDAHLDLRDSYEGTVYSHACVARRLLELGPVVHVGVRVACPEELEVIRERDLHPVWAAEIAGEPPSSTAWIDRVLEQLGPDLYVSVDVDGLDPAVIPATGTPVPGGIGWYQLLALLRAVGQRHVVGCDLCELAPRQGEHGSAFAAAMLAYKMIGYFWKP
jgi:agmatinase